MYTTNSAYTVGTYYQYRMIIKLLKWLFGIKEELTKVPQENKKVYSSGETVGDSNKGGIAVIGRPPVHTIHKATFLESRSTEPPYNPFDNDLTGLALLVLANEVFDDPTPQQEAKTHESESAGISSQSEIVLPPDALKKISSFALFG